MYEKVPVYLFFFYIDIIQVFIDDFSIFLLAPNFHIKVVVEKYYYDSIVRNIKKLVGNEYKIHFIIGVIYIDNEKKIQIRLQTFKSLSNTNIEEILYNINYLRKSKNFFVYIRSDKKMFKNKINYQVDELKSIGFNGIKTNLHYLLKYNEKVKKIIDNYNLILLCEKKYDCDFYLLLKRHIHKIKPFLENNNVIFISDMKLNVLQDNFLNIS
jgi:hypothetical protein